MAPSSLAPYRYYAKARGRSSTRVVACERNNNFAFLLSSTTQRWINKPRLTLPHRINHWRYSASFGSLMLPPAASMVSARGCGGGVKESSQIETWHRTPCRGVRADPDRGFDAKFRGQVSIWRESPNLAFETSKLRNLPSKILPGTTASY